MSDKQPKTPVKSTASLKSRLDSTWKYLTKTKEGRLVLIALSLIIITGVSLLYILSKNYNPNIVENGFIPKAEEAIYSPLTGRKLDDEKLANRPVTAVMIENSPEARPQSGLKQAGLVYEAIAEGGVSRFVVFYQEDKPKLIGPVRSLRQYYVEWLAAYDPAVAHVGGSKKSLDMIRTGKYGTDIDEFFNAPSYWRANDRYAPHNVYTDTSRLDKLIKSKSKTTSNFTPIARQNTPKEMPKTTAKSIKMDISSGSYAVSYAYDSKTNSYLRKQGGATHKDREKGSIKPDVVIAIKVKQHKVNQDGYRESIKTTGSGEAFIFQNGEAIKAEWQKKSAKDQIKFLDSDGKEIKLNRGQTWITAVPSDKGVSWQ